MRFSHILTDLRGTLSRFSIGSVRADPDKDCKNTQVSRKDGESVKSCLTKRQSGTREGNAAWHIDVGWSGDGCYWPGQPVL